MTEPLDKYKAGISNISGKLQLGKLDNKKIFLLILSCLVIFYIDFTFLLKLQINGLKNLAPKVATLRKDIKQLSKDLVMLQDLKNKEAANEQKTGAAKLKKLISEDEIPFLLQTISEVAHKNNVKIVQMNTSQQAKAEQVSTEKLSPITIKLDLSSNYHSTGSFINDLENIEQFVEVQDMKIARNAGNYFLQNTTLNLKTYVKK
jgi:Tfp pilus assembly protein PilO